MMTTIRTMTCAALTIGAWALLGGCGSDGHDHHSSDSSRSYEERKQDRTYDERKNAREEQATYRPYEERKQDRTYEERKNAREQQ
jgi:hypothetical protein